MPYSLSCLRRARRQPLRHHRRELIDKETSERVDRAAWRRIVTFQNGLVHILEKHAQWGRLVYFAGKLQDLKWR